MKIQSQNNKTKHYIDITRAQWQIKSLTTGLCTIACSRWQIDYQIPHCWPFARRIHWWSMVSLTKASNAQCFHGMTSLCETFSLDCTVCSWNSTKSSRDSCSASVIAVRYAIYIGPQNNSTRLHCIEYSNKHSWSGYATWWPLLGLPSCRPPHKWYFDQIQNLTRIGSALVWNMLNWSQRNFAHITTVTLSWHVQNFVVISKVHFKPEHCKIWSNFEFNQNIVSGICARYPIISIKSIQCYWKLVTCRWNLLEPDF